jgi:hypothetical protein
MSNKTLSLGPAISTESLQSKMHIATQFDTSWQVDRKLLSF